MQDSLFICFVVCKVKATHNIIYVSENERLILIKVILMLLIKIMNLMALHRYNVLNIYQE